MTHEQFVNNAVRAAAVTLRTLAVVITMASLLSLPAMGEIPKTAGKQTVQFYLHGVKCLAETNHNEWLGSDEIYLGGVAAGPDKKAKKIRVFKVHGDFDKGEVKTYKPPLLLASFDATPNKPGAKLGYHVSLVLVEKDHGSLAKFFDQYDEKLKTELQKSATGTGDPVLIALSQLAGPVFNQIKKLLGDDPFKPKNLSFKSPSKRQTLSIKGNGGAHYVATYEWRLVNQGEPAK